MALGCLSFLAASNLILAATGVLSLPLYFSFFGSEAAARFSLLLCVHSVLMTVIPGILKSALPMLQLLLFVGLLLLPFNTTPVFIVWSYQKVLHLSESGFLLIEAVMGVLVVMYVSQSLVNEIDEHPIVGKSCIIAISGVSYLLSTYLGFKIFSDSQEIWIGCFAVFFSVLMFVVCLCKEEGIISDAAFVALQMMFIIWSMKQERLMQENSLDAPAQWLQSISDNHSFLSLLLSMATASLEHVARVQRIISIFLSPVCLLLSLLRVASVLGFAAIVQLFYSEEKEESCNFYKEEPRPYRNLFRPLCIRLIAIFVYTEVVIRTIDTTTSYNAPGVGNRSTSVDLLPMLTGIRVWRIVQLITVPCTYLYQLFKQID
ncbi:uncharacterized protein [Montipora capricornis]|uniref:uncharacterized protein isoform X1 n=1 Tax=Montipora capricornis TaxID=246305 RepID=UPI0035F1EB16